MLYATSIDRRFLPDALQCILGSLRDLFHIGRCVPNHVKLQANLDDLTQIIAPMTLEDLVVVILRECTEGRDVIRIPTVAVSHTEQGDSCIPFFPISSVLFLICY